jgi:hypothetical protein
MYSVYSSTSSPSGREGYKRQEDFGIMGQLVCSKSGSRLKGSFNKGKINKSVKLSWVLYSPCKFRINPTYWKQAGVYTR